MKTILFQIITPEKIVLSDQVVQAVIPTTSGEITVLPNHIPLISVLTSGVIEAKKENGSKIIMAVSGGFIEVSREKISILADSAEKAEDLDLAIIEEAKKQAQKTKEKIENQDQQEFIEASAQIAKELAREKAVKKWRKI